MQVDAQNEFKNGEIGQKDHLLQKKNICNSNTLQCYQEKKEEGENGGERKRMKMTVG